MTLLRCLRPRREGPACASTLVRMDARTLTLRPLSTSDQVARLAGPSRRGRKPPEQGSSRRGSCLASALAWRAGSFAVELWSTGGEDAVSVRSLVRDHRPRRHAARRRRWGVESLADLGARRAAIADWHLTGAPFRPFPASAVVGHRFPSKESACRREHCHPSYSSTVGLFLGCGRAAHWSQRHIGGPSFQTALALR